MNRRGFAGWIAAAVAVALNPLSGTSQEPSIEDDETPEAEVTDVNTEEDETPEPTVKPPRKTPTAEPEPERTVPPDDDLSFPVRGSTVVVATLDETGRIDFVSIRNDYYWRVRDMAEELGPLVTFNAIAEELAPEGSG